MFLDCIVGEVDHLVIEVIEVVLLWRSTNVTIVIPVPFEIAVHRCYQNVAPDVEFTLVNQKALLHVLLHNHTPFLTAQTPTQLTLQFLDVWVHCDSEAPVRILARLENPQVMRTGGGFSWFNLIEMAFYVLKGLRLSRLHIIGDWYKLKRIPPFPKYC